MEIFQMMKTKDLHVVDPTTMDLPKVFNMLHTLIGTWDLVPQHFIWFKSLFCNLYINKVLI